MKKIIIKSILFITILIIIWYFVFKVLWIGKTPISSFYDEPKNTIDIAYIGSSNVYTHFNSTLAYHLYGFSTGMLSSSTQPFQLAKYLIKESEKYQKPKLYIIDIAKFADDRSYFDSGGIRSGVDSMKFSKNRIDAINDILEFKKVDKSEYIYYYFSFFLYHNKWKNFKFSDLKKESEMFKGYILSEVQVNVEPVEEYSWITEKSNLPKENKESLLDLIDYIKNNNINVLFVIPKKYFDEKLQSKLNDAKSIIEENGLEVINFNNVEELNNINFETDLYNSNHLNVYGATKFTLYFAKYLKERYDLPNHKGNPLYDSWESEYARFKTHYKELTNKNFDDLLKENEI